MTGGFFINNIITMIPLRYTVLVIQYPQILEPPLKEHLASPPISHFRHFFPSFSLSFCCFKNTNKPHHSTIPIPHAKRVAIPMPTHITGLVVVSLMAPLDFAVAVALVLEAVLDVDDTAAAGPMTPP